MLQSFPFPLYCYNKIQRKSNETKYTEEKNKFKKKRNDFRFCLITCKYIIYNENTAHAPPLYI